MEEIRSQKEDIYCPNSIKSQNIYHFTHVLCGKMETTKSVSTEKTEAPRTISCLGEGNGTPLQYSCLENPMDGGAW